ncbi:glycosyltransferase family 2 protein [Nordella sp. HKS 07]|uniref:glycosyltransferase family 2 protein n=1 Tax=Nordella sp. HKS 07 TaxID=2712222 RepID=UPI0013E18710|nr:glycosyltransferase family 2 protein [Nordella sp. HKS 07]QIG51841.1 glycosyltransferase family 2 protein [Nordella sp. HKS 07]
MPQPSISIVIVTYNSEAVLPGLLESLPAALDGLAKVSIYIVDNNSRDGSAEVASKHALDPILVQMGRNAGYAAGINAAIEKLDADAHLLVLNPDIRLQKGSVKVLLSRLNDPGVGVVVPRILSEDGTTAWSLRREPSILTAWLDGLLGGTLAAWAGIGEMIGKKPRYDRGGAIEWATGAILMISAKALHETGKWDESFFLYSEEVDYMRRIRDRGLAIQYVPEACALHIGRDYTQNPRLSALMSANRIRYYRRYHGVFAAAMFQLGVIVAELIRSTMSASHRAALAAALMPETTARRMIEQQRAT